jgi:hypothetical protein
MASESVTFSQDLVESAFNLSGGVCIKTCHGIGDL